MNRTAAWVTLLVALIASFAWARLERARPRPVQPLPVVAVPDEAPPGEAPVEAGRATAAAVPAPGPASGEAAQEPTRSEARPEPAAPARTFPVRVLTRASLDRDAGPVPGIAFQVFGQRSRLGTRAGPGAPLPHVPTDRVLFEGRTGADGTASFEVDAAGLVISESELPLLCARVVEPGFQQVTCEGKGRSRDVEFRLPVHPGATARGRVVDHEGRGVEAEVRLRWMREGAAGRQIPAFGPPATGLADGWFELHFLEPMRGAWLLAEARGLGTGTLCDLVLDPARPPGGLRIELRGPGVLRGRVRDGDGEPAQEVDLLVRLAQLDHGDSELEQALHLAREREGGGFVERRLQTDARGEFEVRGLRREPYVVRARVGQKRFGEHPQLLTPRAVLADGQPLELALQRPHVLVRVVGFDGEPFELSHHGREWTPPEGWPSESSLSRVVLLPCTPTGTEPLATGDPLAGKLVWPNEALFEVPSDARYLVGAFGRGFDGSVQVVEVPAGANRVEVELRAREPGPLGSAALRVVNGGRELGPNDELAIRLETLAERVPLFALQARLPPPPWVLNAPPGRYRVVVEGKPGRSAWHGTFTSPRAFGRVEEEVELRAGLTQELTLELDGGARVEVTLSGTPDEADRAAVRRGDAWNPPQEPEDDSLRPVLATLTLEQPGRRPETLTFTRPAGPTAASGTDLLSRWPLGATQLSEVCPTGRYTLVARLPGGREVRREVELVAGQTTAVRLEF